MWLLPVLILWAQDFSRENYTSFPVQHLALSQCHLHPPPPPTGFLWSVSWRQGQLLPLCPWITTCFSHILSTSQGRTGQDIWIRSGFSSQPGSLPLTILQPLAHLPCGLGWKRDPVGHCAEPEGLLSSFLPPASRQVLPLTPLLPSRESLLSGLLPPHCPSWSRGQLPRSWHAHTPYVICPCSPWVVLSLLFPPSTMPRAGCPQNKAHAQRRPAPVSILGSKAKFCKEGHCPWG